MTTILKTQAVIIAYDVTSVMQLIRPVIRDWFFSSRIDVIQEDYLLDLWFSHTLHHFEVVSTIESIYHDFNNDVLSFISRTTEAVSELWRIIDIPVELSGCAVTIKRFRNVLWIIYLDADITQHLPKNPL